MGLNWFFGLGFLATAVMVLVAVTWKIDGFLRVNGEATSTDPATLVGTSNTVVEGVSGILVQADKVEGGASRPSCGGDRIDFSSGTFHSQVTGKHEEHHHYGAAPTALNALPAPSAGFIGRIRELADLLDALAPSPDVGEGPTGVVVSALSGMGGVGKTALALTAGAIATRGSSAWFSGALFIDLRGYTPNAQPVTAHQALDALLRALGVDSVYIPHDTSQRAGLYRSQLAEAAAQRGGPLLVVADNAVTTDQVQPLMPGLGGHRLLVTSRERFTLAGARQVDVDVLSPSEARDMLARILHIAAPDDERANDAEGLDQLASACGHLPLALEISAALLVRVPALSPTRLTARLIGGPSRLSRLEQVLAALAASFEHLSPKQAEVLLLLGAAPGPDISTESVAVLTGQPTEEVLEELASAHLLTHRPAPHQRPGWDRWGMHDLVSDFVRHHLDPPDARDRARRRLLDHYTATAAAADDHLRALPGHSVPPAFSGRKEALAWLDAERANLVAAVGTAQSIGHTTAAVRLPMKLAAYLDWRRYFTDWEVVTRLAQHTANVTGDHRGEAMAWNDLGIALSGVRRFSEALDALAHARDLNQQLGDLHGEAMAWNNLGNVFSGLRRFDEAIDSLMRARDLHQQAGKMREEAMAWNNLGIAFSQARRFNEALDTLTRARHLNQQLGDTHGEAKAWNNLGVALSGLHCFDESIDAHMRARHLHHQVGDFYREATAWHRLGVVLGRADRFDEAAQWLGKAVSFFRDAGDRHAEAQSCYELAISWTRTGHPDKAVPLLERTIELLEEANDPHLYAQAHKELARNRRTSNQD